MATTIDSLHQKVNNESVKGFLANDEAEALNNLANEVGWLGPCLEVGSYCGKSTIYLAEGCRQSESVVFAVDHHRGSEEHQLGEEYHDPDLYNLCRSEFDSLPEFRRNMASFGLEDYVIPVVSSSERLLAHWATPLAMVFIDGGHSPEVAYRDCMQWSQHLIPGGVLAIHDIFELPEDGGQGPYLAYKAVLARGGFYIRDRVNSLAILVRE